MLWVTLVLSHFNYCNFIYSPYLTAKDKSRIQKVQNWCCCFIYKLRRYDHVSHKMKELGWLNMENRRKYQMGSFVFSPTHLLFLPG